ncbi:MAG: hypothetical protein ABSF35_00405 [Polyangia bacterium]
MSEPRDHEDEEEPRKGFWATLPRGTITRVFVLLMLLASVVVLQRKAGAIAGCMNQTFMLPQPRAIGTSADGGEPSARGPIHVQVRVPEPATR